MPNSTYMYCRFPPEAPFLAYSGEHSGVCVDVVMPGKCAEHGVDNVGTVPSAVLAYAALEAFHPDLLINAGTAGGFKVSKSRAPCEWWRCIGLRLVSHHPLQAKGAAIGDVYLATHIANHDRRIPLPVSWKTAQS